MSITIFIHRRDLRINDNISIYKCYHNIKNNIIIPIFIFDPEQIIKNEKNKYYFSSKSAYFIIKSVIDLKKQYQSIGSNLLVLYNKPSNCLIKIINILKKASNRHIILSFNLDFSKYSLNRDNELINIANNNNITIITDNNHSDYCLQPWCNKVYKQFGAYYKNAIKNKPSNSFNYKTIFINNKIYNKLFSKIEFLNFDILLNSELRFIDECNQHSKNNKLMYQWLNAGRNNCLLNLKKNINNLKLYNKNRNNLDYNTSNISAYINIGTISIRELYYLLKKKLNNSDIIKQLYWRDFFLNIIKNLPNANEFCHIDKRYDSIKWATSYNKTHKKYKLMKYYWNLMMNSKTGFLLIDAGIKELKISGFLHGRNRMIVGMFWTKYLLINPFDLKYGSQANWSKLLVDAIGPSQNKMNHHWLTEFDFPGKKFAPSGSPLAGRPMNIDNIQIKKFDPNCIYIKKWLPHLNNVDNNDLYKWNKEISLKYLNIHPPPIFNSKEKYKEWIQICKI
jgi:deoxyribodipyrimidine photo-lyase